jgi:hypothetical protein
MSAIFLAAHRDLALMPFMIFYSYCSASKQVADLTSNRFSEEFDDGEKNPLFPSHTAGV